MVHALETLLFWRQDTCFGSSQKRDASYIKGYYDGHYTKEETEIMDKKWF